MAEIIKNPHDKMAKRLFSNKGLARAFFNQHLPAEIKDRVDLSVLDTCKGTFVDKAMREHLTDILYKTKIEDKDAYLYLLIEAQSTADRLMPFRLLEYSVAVMKEDVEAQERLKLKPVLPLVYPLVYYTGKYRYKESRDLFSLFALPDLARKYFLVPFKLIDLSQISDAELKTHPAIRSIEIIQKHIYHRDLMNVLEELLKDGMLLEIEQYGRENLKLVLQYVVNKGHIDDVDKFLRNITDYLPDESETVMTIAQQLKERGVEEGLQEGLQRGRREGRREGRHEGLQEGTHKVAKNLFRLGHPESLIIEATGLDRDSLARVLAEGAG